MDEATASDLKLQLKKWENDFHKKHSRKPSKDDIAESDKEVQDMYRTYYKLKRTLQTVDVWGAELNKDAQKAETAKEKLDKKASFSIGKKLWENSKGISSQTPRLKSGSFNKFSPSITKDENESLNSPRLSMSGSWIKEDTPRPPAIKPKLFQTSDTPPPLLSFNTPPTKGSQIKEQKQSNISDVDCVLQPKKGSTFEKAFRMTQSFKKPGLSPSISNDVYVPVIKKTPVSSFKNIKPDFLTQVQKNFEEIESPVTTPVKKSDLKFCKSAQPPAASHRLTDLDNRVSLQTNEYSASESTKTESRTQNYPNTGRRGSKRKMSDSSPCTDETPGGSDDVFGPDDPFPDMTGIHSPKNKKKPTSKSSWSGSIIKDGNIDTQSLLNNTLSLKPKEVDDYIHTAEKDITKLKQKDEEGEASDHEEKKKTKAKKMGPSKFVGGSSRQGGGGAGINNNYVRLNMKVKTYRRRGGGRTGGQIKRLQWKQKMAARAQSRGSGCFKCGEEGHWARNCKGKKGSNVEKVEDDSPPPENFPSLGDALRMAHGKGKRQKKPNSSKKDDDADKSDEASAITENAEAGESADDYMEELELVRQRQSDRDVDFPRPPPMEPLIPLTEDGKVPEEAPPLVYKALATFGYTTFRPGQKDAVMRILCGQTTLVQLATGAGKSLCYQLPALMYAQQSPCLTIVISPLVSLMEDQVTGLPAGLSGACLHTNMTKPQCQKVVESLEAGDVHFLLLSPEALTSAGTKFLNFSKLPPIAFACIDEAHCVSAWSHNFRPSYLRVCKVLREKLGVNCLLGLTATATRATALNVAEHIGVSDGDEAFIRGKVVPGNLVLSVSRDEDRDRALLQLLQGDRFSTCHSIIIYCTRRETTERLATLIRTNLKDVKHPTKINRNAPKSKSKKAIQSCEAYHAGVSAAGRKRVQLNFMNGSLRIVVATVAFGMGLDKQDVHGIIHYNLPRNFESYVQEIGRAGRDGNTSHCHVFLDERGGDICELKRHIFADTVDRITVKKFIQRFFPQCRCEELHKHFQSEQEGGDSNNLAVENNCPGHERAAVIDSLVKELDMKEEGISTLLCYLELDESRMVEILNPIYATCTITSHSGKPAFTAAAQRCPALAVAIAQAKMRGESFDGRQFTFRVTDVADNLGTTSGIVKREISGLKWIQTSIGGYQRSPLLIEYSDLSFHIRCRGNLTDEEVDQLVDLLHNRILAAEENELQHLHYFYNVLYRVAHKNYYMCADEADIDRSDRLKSCIRKYFDFNQVHLPLDEVDTIHNHIEQPTINEDSVCADVRQFIHLYSHEHTLNARCIARIFHGISSPNFPAEVWGRVRRFWRCHLDIEFNLLLRLAKQTLIGMK